MPHIGIRGISDELPGIEYSGKHVGLVPGSCACPRAEAGIEPAQVEQQAAAERHIRAHPYDSRSRRPEFVARVDTAVQVAAVLTVELEFLLSRRLELERHNQPGRTADGWVCETCTDCRHPCFA